MPPPTRVKCHGCAGPAASAGPPARRSDGLHPLPWCWVAVAQVSGIETHQRWKAVWPFGGRAELSLADERALRRGDVVTLIPQTMCTTMVTSCALVPAPTRSPCWVMTPMTRTHPPARSSTPAPSRRAGSTRPSAATGSYQDQLHGHRLRFAPVGHASLKILITAESHIEYHRLGAVSDRFVPLARTRCHTQAQSLPRERQRRSGRVQPRGQSPRAHR